jgi:hypothetical protein
LEISNFESFKLFHNFHSASEFAAEMLSWCFLFVSGKGDCEKTAAALAAERPLPALKPVRAIDAIITLLFRSISLENILETELDKSENSANRKQTKYSLWSPNCKESFCRSKQSPSIQYARKQIHEPD